MHDETPSPNAPYEPREIRVARQIAAIEAEMIALFAEPAWPDGEILTAYRAKAGIAGCPKACPKSACRRARRCMATDIDKGAACAPHWSAALHRDFEQMTLGILLAWKNRCDEATTLRFEVARWSGAGALPAPLPRAKRSAKRRR
ncbi:hypothetical protein [Aliihoeflea sp. PC F10.4]